LAPTAPRQIWSRNLAGALAGAAAVAALAACDVPFGLDLPTTGSLERGVGASFGAPSLEITGTYTEAGKRWSIDLQLARNDGEHVAIASPDLELEAMVVGGTAYFRGQRFLTQHIGTDERSQELVKAAGSAWWQGSGDALPKLPDLTDGDAFARTFLGAALTGRTDHVKVGGLAAIELSGPRADLYVSAAPPYRPLRLRMRTKAVVDGIAEADLMYSNFGRDFGIAVPSDVIDFSNLSTLPPVYTVKSVDTSGCGRPCVVSALLQNLGGTQHAVAPSSVTFTMVDADSGEMLGGCRATVSPDVGYGATATVGCRIGGVGDYTAARVTATADNPGRA
jgi:hypothetical protein